MCFKSVKSLNAQIRELLGENSALLSENSNLRNQRDGFSKENRQLRQQLIDLRAEYNATIDAKEIERLELCDENQRLMKELDRVSPVRDSKGKFIKKEDRA